MIIEYLIGFVVCGIAIIPLAFMCKEQLIKKHRKKLIDKAINDCIKESPINSK
ncbi:hypothetical protein [Paenibacillus sp. QZ-Y1]|uniref:hypothetical protein n=1 Tax=Paenibacillus sp. QZ-Y1 TaxID=3414511 RepID=UPI003F7A30B0